MKFYVECSTKYSSLSVLFLTRLQMYLNESSADEFEAYIFITVNKTKSHFVDWGHLKFSNYVFIKIVINKM